MTTVRARHTIQTGGHVRTPGELWDVDLSALDRRDYLHIALERGFAAVVDETPTVRLDALADDDDTDVDTNDEG